MAKPSQFNLPTDKGVVFSMEDWRGLSDTLAALQSAIASLTAGELSTPHILVGGEITDTDTNTSPSTWEVSAGLAYYQGKLVLIEAQSIDGVATDQLYAHIETIDGAGEPHQLHDGSGFSGSQVVRTIDRLVFTNDDTDDFFWRDIVANQTARQALTTGAWQNATLQNDWENGSNVVRFRKVGNYIEIDGKADATNATAQGIFTLPVGFRPARQLLLPVADETANPIAANIVRILTDGTVGTIGTFSVDFSYLRFPIK
jgi:hypothetical protein